MESARLYLITPALPRGRSLQEFLPSVLEAGVDIVQLREKDMEGAELLSFCKTARELTRDYGVVFIVNDRIDVAVAAGADGVHLGQGDLPVEEARRQMGPEAIIGLSTHTPGEVTASSAATADYIAVGPVYATPTKPGRPAVGLELVSFAAANSPVPFFAIGGLNRTNLAGVMQAGASRIVVLRAITEAEDAGSEARTLKEILTSSSTETFPS